MYFSTAPSGTPVSISAEYHSSKDTLVTMWADPSCGQRNGVITGFTYMLLDVETDRVEDYGTTELTIVHLPDKDPLKKYKFLVAAKTVAGMGPYGAVSVSGRLEIAESKFASFIWTSICFYYPRLDRS